MTVGSCAQVLDLEDYTDAASELCQLLNRCYGSKGLKGCQDHVVSRLGAADSDGKNEWLTYVSNSKCLTSCQAALDCLDEAPVCKGNHGKCSFLQQCLSLIHISE